MSDLIPVLEEAYDDSGHLPSDSLRQVTSTSKANTRLTAHHHKLKMHKKKMSTFEKRFSQLALKNSLVLERKRIDYVLVNQCRPASNDDDCDDDERRDLEKSDLERRKFTALLEREGFSVQTEIVVDCVYTTLFCPFKRLCREAERVRFEMPINDCPKLDANTGNCFTKFIDKHFETDNEDDFISTQFFMNKIHKFAGYEDPNTFFRPAIRSFLTDHILINLDINELDDDLKVRKRSQEELDAPQEKHGLAHLLHKGYYSDCFILHDESQNNNVDNDYDKHETNNVEGNSYFMMSHSSGNRGLERDERRDLDQTWTRPFKYQPLWKIRNYFGERVAFYFAWSGSLCTTLWLPSIFGIFVFFYGLHESLSDSFKNLFDDFKQSFDNDITPFFGLAICIWGTVFLELWKRKRCELAYEWDVEQFEANEPDRPSFTGTKPKKDPVTDEFVWYYPFRRQVVKFSFSISVLVFMIFIVMISVLAIIIYRVIMDIDYCPDLPAEQCLILTTVLSSLLNTISILLLGRVYNVLARWLTEWENHQTQTKYDDALIFKLFAFQFVNSYASCFYIAFFRGRFSSLPFLGGDRYRDSCEGSCMTQLSFQVLTLMVLKPMPKFFKDVGLVWAKKLLSKLCNVYKPLQRLSCLRVNQVSAKDVEASLDKGKMREHHTKQLMYIRQEHLKPKLGDFTLDEFTEKIIQYGFLMLFTTSFPLAPMLALVTNMFDLRVDAKRLLWWYRRPIAYVGQDIGMWYDILLFVNFVGVVSNAFLIAFTSSWGAKYSNRDKLIIVVVFEVIAVFYLALETAHLLCRMVAQTHKLTLHVASHLVFLLKYVIAYLIPDKPAHVTLSIRREQYQIQKKMDETKEMDFSHLFPIFRDEFNDGEGNERGVGAPVDGLHGNDISAIRQRLVSGISLGDDLVTNYQSTGPDVPQHPSACELANEPSGRGISSHSANCEGSSSFKSSPEISPARLNQFDEEPARVKSTPSDQ